MGIPSYYRKLLDTNPGLVSTVRPDAAAKVDWLFMDFNCIIYECLGSMEPPPPLDAAARPVMDEAARQARGPPWNEDDLCTRVIETTECMIRTIGPVHGTFIAIDGVVPMAKMRQQRLRRFKSAASGRDSIPSWDKNAITPGTAFMNHLCSRLLQWSKTETGHVRISGSNEPGEGEHKLLHELRHPAVEGMYRGANLAVYGLDADLILLSLLGSHDAACTIWLYRLQQSSPTENTPTAPVYEWFSIAELRTWLLSMNRRLAKGDAQEAIEWVWSYVFAMSFLGNDFLPRSLSLTLRNDGHALLLEHLQALRHPLIDSTCTIQWSAVHELIRSFAATEEDRIRDGIRQRIRFLHRASTLSSSSSSSTGDMAIVPHIEEEPLLHAPATFDRIYLALATRSNSRFSTLHPLHLSLLSMHYLQGLQWVWTYYTHGYHAICYQWYYPFSLPPRWSWMTMQEFTSNAISLPPIEYRAEDLQPVEQLALVLPLSSWSLLPPADPIRAFPLLAPYFFPTVFEYDTVGRRYLWECEACIPIPSIRELKQIGTSSPSPPLLT